MIQLHNLTKNYGDFKAVDQISFNVDDGEILGFLGPNGAGKTTTLRMITSYLEKTAGQIIVNDYEIQKNPQEIRKLIGYMPENNPLYHDMIVYDYLKFIAAMRDIKEKEFEKAFARVVEKCGLNDVVYKQIHELSKGYRQRVGLAQAIIHDPQILILDEPTSGLDPNQILEIRELIIELGKEKTLIISSHILQEVQAVCDRIVIINKGKIVANGTPDELKASIKGKTKLTINYQDNLKEMKDILTVFPAEIIEQKEAENQSKMIKLAYNEEDDFRVDFFKKIKETEIIILEMKREYTSLESVFTTLTRSNNSKIEGANNELH